MVNSQSVKTCIIDLGKELDSIDMLAHVIEKQLGAGIKIESLMTMATEVLPDACTIVKKVYVDGQVQFDSIYDQISEIIRIIKTVRSKTPRR